MFSFIRRHWVVYLIGLVLAIALGLGAAVLVGIKGSTPASTHAEEVKQEQSTEEKDALSDKTKSEESETSSNGEN